MTRQNNQNSAKSKTTGALQEQSLALQIVNRYLLWIIILLAAILILCGYTFVLSGKIQQLIAAASESVPAKRKVLSDLQSIRNDLDKVVLKFSSIKKEKEAVLARFEELLPRESKYDELFTIVDDVTRRSGLQLRSINIGFSEVGATGVSAPAFTRVTPGSENKISSPIKTLTLSLNVEGGDYETFKGYLENLERNIRLFDVKSLSFSGGSIIPIEEGAEAASQYDIELVTYYQDQ